MLKITRQLGFVCQDMEPAKSTKILRKSSHTLKPIRCVRFTEGVLCHTNIRDQNPSLGLICPYDPHQRNPKAQNVRIALRRRQSGKSKVPAKQRERATFFSPSENWCLLASNLKPEEREFVVDSGASMHMISKIDLNSAELETVATSRSPTTVITANGEVQTHEEATVYVKELDIFLTMKVLEDTPAVLSLGKLCDEHGYSYEWINGQKPHLIKNVIRIPCNTENFVPIVVQGLSTSSSSGSYHSTSMTPSRQERHCSTSSSSSSSSPTTSSSSDIETREREDQTESDTSPVL